jgi:hypothetical protein
VLPAVPAVEPVEPGVLLAAPPAVEPAPPLAPLGLVLLPVLLALDPPEPMRALVSMNCPAREVPAVAPAVPLVPVAPAVLPLPVRHPVTVTVRLLLDV